MAAAAQTVDLTRLRLASGQGWRTDLEVDAGDLELGGDRYRLSDAAAAARLDVSRTVAGYALRLRFGGRLEGPCMRCLEPASVAIEVDSREVDQPGTSDDELSSPYVADGVLDVGAWAHDALVLAVPAQVHCREDCAGLCPVCGESLNEAEPGAHGHPSEPDPRWAKLRELG